MPYDHSKQYRCPIVRGKALTDLDDLLPTYAHIIQEICPTNKTNFKESFNGKLAQFLAGAEKKTLDNHRTEIAGKLFGMYYEDSKETIQISERTLKLIEDSDQPSFFKDLCAKYQFPSCMNKMNTVMAQINSGINIRQLSFVMKVIFELSNKRKIINKKEVGYYILNSLDVLSGNATPTDVISQISEDRINGMEREVSEPGREHSYNHQHINEQLNLLALANCIIFDNQNIIINYKEMDYIKKLSDKYNAPNSFDFSQYDLTNRDHRRKVQIDYDKHFAKFSDLDKSVLNTPINSLINLTIPDAPQNSRIDTNALGDEGEEYIYQLERSRVEKEFPRLVNKINKLGKIKGLGYDIQSVLGIKPKPEFAKYIEVKSTKRVSAPTDTFRDTINLTRNEWTAAEQHKENFFIYRVYFCQNETKVFVIQNPFGLNNDGKIYAIPLSYRIDFDQKSGNFCASE